MPFHVQVLVNNAGTAYEGFAHGIADITPKTLTDTFTLNTFGPILVTQALLKQVGLYELPALHGQLECLFSRHAACLMA
jgi:NAD(P)-dependent dehydrogenase (short-subunit alcohol dehydrogenase family)